MNDLPGVQPPPKPRDELRRLKRENRLMEQQMKLRRLKREHRRLESLSLNWVTPYLDMLDRYRRDDILPGGPAAGWHRTLGRNYPLFQTEAELALLRAPARVLASSNSYAIGLMEGLTSYVISTGYRYRAASRRKANPAPQELLDRCQDIIDEFEQRTEWHGGELPGLEEELFVRSVEDGEFLLIHFPMPDGKVEVRTAEPEQLTQPPGSDLREWSFGVRTLPEDTQRPLGYWIAWDPANPADGEELPPERVTHFRRNVKRSIKRGMTDFSFDTFETLNSSAALLGSLAEGAAEQASIVSVMQHAIGTKEDIQAFVDSDADFQERNPLNGQESPVKRYRRGTHLHVPEGQTYVPPPNATNGPVHLSILQACLRAAGVRWNAPEWLVSGDASNNNYASSLTAEAPFTRTIQRRQPQYAQAFRRTFWYVLEHHANTHGGIHAGGRTWGWGEIQALVDILVEHPTAQVRNRLEEAQRNQIEIGLGIQSRQIAAAESGRDFAQILADNEEYLARTGGVGGGDPLPGLDGFGASS
ncbi:phage portal protein [Tuwongella immobilis]|uniref:Phage portal protein n=1 Tax=Tuwongella immobilis TaxID=692036 RepID=A0A6C2YPG2_9BACT|nr:phage portal protein [Tuwongella immobilis]VIP03079.1 phage portal lambda family : Uncharacterized protein OS=Blastopirellula marina DSM 3645 GN=DSM3645_28872 PE=4 SV=1: Phage_portal_2 [Tuwongella immobilis]VTS03324.1 phage portal lambda family : Uncharacterized protein OS=Blastopirellula marina DSM 3645 GN=DSM3645_28872 PE=4 SV=1: Phage_portal_2 [Tuwongella immobilis]